MGHDHDGSHSERALKGSEGRLWRMIEERTRHGADTAAIDKRLWDLFGEELAVVFTDLTGFSRRVAAFGIIHFLQEIFEQRRLLFPVIEKHDGILLKTEADSFLIIFRRAQAALECAIEMQHVCQQFNRRRTAEDQVLLCAGVGFGKMLRIGDEDVFGQEVNAASKLGEDIAKANEILVTDAARMSIGDSVAGVTFTDLGPLAPGSVRDWRVEYQHR